MGLPPLESARLKIDRAEKHVRTLNQCVQRFLDRDPYPVTRHLEREGAEHVYRVHIRAETPGHFGTIVGDCLHNLRSALDSIVYDLSAPSVPTLTEQEERSIGFPIAFKPENYNGGSARFAPPAAQTEIERSQPYCRPPASEDHLWLLHDFNRVDKHRAVHVVPATSHGSQHTPYIGVEERFHPLGPFEDGTELARFIFPSPQPDMDVNFRPMFSVSLRDGPVPAVVELESMAQLVRHHVLPRFERFFNY